jgi:hypothetical protein
MCSEKLQVFKFSQNLGRASGRLFQKIGIFQINPNVGRGKKLQVHAMKRIIAAYLQTFCQFFGAMAIC